MKNNPEQIKIGENGAVYGSWRAAPAVHRYINIISVLAILTLFSRSVLKQNILATVFGIAMLAVGGYYFYLNKIKHMYSYVGGSIMEKNHIELTKHLEWDGNGTAIDVGCGTAPLTVRMAKVFPETKVWGVDNWGMLWSMSKDQCTNNAKKEGVDEQCVFDQSDIVKLPYDDGKFDAMVSSFAYSEVKRKTDKKPLIRESLMVIKKRAPFAIQDFFGKEKMFGTPEEIIKWMKRNGVTEVHYQAGEDEIGLFWGRK